MKGKRTSPNNGFIENQKESFKQTLGKFVCLFICFQKNYSKQNHVDGRLYILLLVS